MKAGDVYLVNYPFSDLSATKIRPAIVLAVVSHGDAISVLVTSQAVPKAITLDAAGLAAGGLHKVSYVVPDHLFTAGPALIGKRLAKLTSAKFKEIRDGVIAVIRKG